MSNKRKAKKKASNKGFLLALVFTATAALAIYFVFTFISVTNENKQKKEELEQLQTKYEQQMQQNKELQDTIEETTRLKLLKNMHEKTVTSKQTKEFILTLHRAHNFFKTR
jgi:cell division protein FtsL